MVERRPIIGVMGSHEDEWEDYADPIGDLIARRGYHLLTGAGAGVMTAAARAFVSVRDREGICLGICPVPVTSYSGVPISEKEFPNSHVDAQLIVPLDAKAQGDAVPYSRNMMNIMTSHAVVVLPGAHGTKNEVSLALKYNKPLVLFGPDSAFVQFPQEPLHTDNIRHVAQFFDDIFGAEE